MPEPSLNSTMNPKANFYFEKAKKWKKEQELLRKILLSCELNEEVKWGCPCYTQNDQNIVLIHAFKDYCALLFFKGVLMKDPEKLLIQQTENVQSARQLRFTEVTEIMELEPVIRAYVFEALEIEKAGLEVEFKQTKEYEMPEELQEKLDEDPEFKKAFEALTPGRQRGYLLYFGKAKQSKTRYDRVEKYRQAIMEGKGLND